MKRSFVVACALALALVFGLSASAGAGTQVSAEPAAKKGAKKGKSCKKKAGKGKAGKSAAAQAKKKGKSKGCKPKGKKGGNQGKNGAKVPDAPPVAPPAAAVLGDGLYGDPAKLLELNVSNGATTVVLKYVPPGFCAGINYTSQPVPLTKSGDTWTASETRSFTIIGEPANVKWDLTVKEGLAYALNLTLESDSMIGLCKGEGHPTGTLTKVG